MASFVSIASYENLDFLEMILERFAFRKVFVESFDFPEMVVEYIVWTVHSGLVLLLPPKWTQL